MGNWSVLIITANFIEYFKLLFPDQMPDKDRLNKDFHKQRVSVIFSTVCALFFAL